ncbi:type II toxin-antitoxin system RelE/ParE family toxin [Ralstonia sp. UNC404CL21Col]|uniref:type II toxin-antitoxin system RelE/ParE family toxin n=1 Tax=Ralstonia sp. UNC404CL21Col TaxID=1380362 RepID=UPI0004842B49|nr:type II toxin-antitoxin system RelE/ParE family toxin [Ralstonia sp. UNC404CL21Col]
MNTIHETETFANWLQGLADRLARARIASRIQRARSGNFGDWKSVGEGVCEMRIDHGPGYRVYYTQRGDTVYILLCGGDKGSQSKDINKAREMAKQVEG